MAATDSGLGTLWSTTQGYFLTQLTDLFLPYIADAKNNASVLLSQIPEASERIAGKYLFMPVKYGRNTDAISAVREGGKLPDSGSARSRPYMFRPRKCFTRAIIDGDIYRASQMEAVRYLEPLSDIMEQMGDDMAVEVNRQLHGDGSGRLAEVTALVAAGAGGQLDIRLNQNIESVATCTSSPAQFLTGEYLGSRIAFFSSAGVLRGIRYVVALVSETVGPPSAARITTDASPTGVGSATPAGIVAGDWIVRCARVVADSGSTTEVINSGFRTELPGIAGIFSDSFVLDGNGVAVLPAGASNYVGQDEFAAVGGATVGFQGVPTDGTLPFNQALILADAGGALREPTEELLQNAISRCEKLNNAEIDSFMSNYGERDRFGDQLIPDKRYTNTTTLSGGWTALDMKGKPWMVDRHCLANRIYGMGLKSGGFRQYVKTPFQPLAPLGQHWYRLQDDDKYQAAWVMEGTSGVDVRNRCGFLLTDIRAN